MPNDRSREERERGLHSFASHRQLKFQNFVNQEASGQSLPIQRLQLESVFVESLQVKTFASSPPWISIIHHVAEVCAYETSTEGILTAHIHVCSMIQGNKGIVMHLSHANEVRKYEIGRWCGVLSKMGALKPKHSSYQRKTHLFVAEQNSFTRMLRPFLARRQCINDDYGFRMRTVFACRVGSDQ
jgi:hypothetical protein